MNLSKRSFLEKISIILPVIIIFTVAFVLVSNGQKGGDATMLNSQTIQIYDHQTNALKTVEKINKSEDEWRRVLPQKVFHITRKKGTERPFSGTYNDIKAKGVFQCFNCGTDLFLSQDKFESGTGWPSFTKPISSNNVTLLDDSSFFMHRKEVVCARCGAHLGHIFDDGPQPTGKRFCINSLSLKFIEF